MEIGSPRNPLPCPNNIMSLTWLMDEQDWLFQTLGIVHIPQLVVLHHAVRYGHLCSYI